MAKRAQPQIAPDLIDKGLPTGIFSASQYSTFKKCGEAYQRRYIKKVASATNGSMFRGTLVHAGAEAAHVHMIENKAIPALEQMKAVISDEFDRESKDVDWGEEKSGEVKDAALSSYTLYHRTALPTINPVAAEKHFAAKVGIVPVQGYIDMIDFVRGPTLAGVEDPGTMVVMDMKTSTTSWSQSKLDKDPQFTLYSVVEHTPFVRVENLVQLKAGPKLVRLSASKDAATRRALIEDMEESVDLIKKGIFPKAPIDSWACTEDWCPYWKECRGRKW